MYLPSILVDDIIGSTNRALTYDFVFVTGIDDTPFDINGFQMVLAIERTGKDPFVQTVDIGVSGNVHTMSLSRTDAGQSGYGKHRLELTGIIAGVDTFVIRGNVDLTVGIGPA